MMMPCPHCKGTGQFTCGSICEVFALKRVESGLSLRSVNCQTGLAVSTISRLENGKAADWGTIVKLARFYGLALCALAELPLLSGEQA